MSYLEAQKTLVLHGKRVPAVDYEVLKKLANLFIGQGRSDTSEVHVKAAAVAYAVKVLGEWRAAD